MRVAGRVKFRVQKKECLAILQRLNVLCTSLIIVRAGRQLSPNEVLEKRRLGQQFLSSFAESRAEPGTFFHLPKKSGEKLSGKARLCFRSRRVFERQRPAPSVLETR